MQYLILAEATTATSDMGKAGALVGICSVIVMVITQFLKSPLLKEVLKKVPKKYRIWVPVGLSGISAGLGAYMMGLGWKEAVGTAVGTAFASVGTYRLVLKKFFGKKQEPTVEAVAQAAEPPASEAEDS